MKIIYDARELKRIINQAKICTTDSSRPELSRIYFNVLQGGTTRITNCNGYMLECVLIYGKLCAGEILDFSIPAKFSIPYGTKQVVVEKSEENSDVSFSYPDLGFSNVFKCDDKGRAFMTGLEEKLNPTTEEDFSVCLDSKMMIEAIKSATQGCFRMSRVAVKVRFYKDGNAVTFEPMREKEGQKSFLLKIRD